MQPFEEPADPAWEMLRGGVKLRNDGDYRAALPILEAAHRSAPSKWQPLYEIGVLYEAVGWYDAATAAYQDALSRNAAATKALERVVARRACDGRHDLVPSAIAMANHRDRRVARSALEASQFAQFVADHPLEVSRSWFEGLLDSRGGMLSRQAVVAGINAAIGERRPFALVRLGDGEGTWLHHNQAEEDSYGALYERNRNAFFDIWFGNDRGQHKQRFNATTVRITESLAEADMIGVPPWSWIEHEHRIASLRGYSGTLNAARVADAHSRGAPLCNQLIHLDLYESGALADLLTTRVKRLGVISCHRDLPKLLKKKFGLEDVLFFPIPGEPTRKSYLGPDAVMGEHYPARYQELVDEISRGDFSGTTFLVAGGILGKHYTLMLKAAGAVAVDVGSMAAKWMGRTGPR